MFRSRRISRPSYYAAVPFHTIRVCSLISTLVTTTIMSYFIYNLTHDEFKIPWAFFVLTAASVLTLLNLTITGIIECSARLSPVLSMVNNSILLILWIVSMSLLGVSMSGTLKHTCSIENWGNETGILVCRIYKVLFTFTVTGFSAQVLSVGLDYFTRRAKNRRGNYNAYNAMDEEVKERESIVSGSSGSSFNDPSVDALNAFGTSRPAPKLETPSQQYSVAAAEPYYASDTTQGVTWNSNPLPYPDTAPQSYAAYNPAVYQSYGDGGYRR